MRHRFRLAFGVLALGAFLTACGDSSGPATVMTAAPSRAATSAPVASPVVAAPATALSVAPAATTAPTPAASVPAATVVSTPVAGSPGTTGGNGVAVEVKDVAITLSTSVVNAGIVSVTVRNAGPSPHNFNLMIAGEEKGIPTLDSGKTATLMLDLRPGTYDFRCNIPGHSLLGMKATLTVK